MHLWKWRAVLHLLSSNCLKTMFAYMLTAALTLDPLTQIQPTISPDKARKGVIYPLKTGIYALVGISERTFTR